jgi:hypothetical protein
VSFPPPRPAWRALPRPRQGASLISPFDAFATHFIDQCGIGIP